MSEVAYDERFIESRMIYIPGWGYPAAFWNEACGLMHQQWSWGYWEEPKQLAPCQGDRIVVHSFGLYMLSPEWFDAAAQVIWYGGFFEALPFAQKTLESFSQNPRLIIEKFVRRAFFPHPPKELTGQFDKEKLLFDLHRLVCFDYCAFWENRKALSEKIICVHGDNDRIVSERSGRILPNIGHMPDSDRGVWKQYLTHLLNGKNG